MSKNNTADVEYPTKSWDAQAVLGPQPSEFLQMARGA
jgi:hypothetical protein